MAFNRPTVSDLNDRIANDIETRAPGSEPRLRRSLFGVLGRVLAGAVHGLYGFLDYQSKQILPDSADSDYLARHASIWNIARKPATAAIGHVTFTGNNGIVIPAGTVLQRSDAVEFVTDNDVTIAAGSISAAVTAVIPAAASNTAAGVALSLISIIAGVDTTALVDANGLTNGADNESDASLRLRLLTRIQQPPHGGAAHDYIAWALAVPGVTRAWVYPEELGLGSVTVRIVRDDDVSIIPDATEIQAVQDYIDSVRPVTANVVVVAPIAVPLNLTIDLTPNNTLVQAAVQAEIEDVLRREALPGGTLLLSHLREAISIASGETNHVLISPTTDVIYAAGKMAIMGTITWQ